MKPTPAGLSPGRPRPWRRCLWETARRRRDTSPAGLHLSGALGVLSSWVWGSEGPGWPGGRGWEEMSLVRGGGPGPSVLCYPTGQDRVLQGLWGVCGVAMWGRSTGRARGGHVLGGMGDGERGPQVLTKLAGGRISLGVGIWDQCLQAQFCFFRGF